MKQGIKLPSILFRGAFYGWVSAVMGLIIFLFIIQLLMIIRYDPIPIKFLSIGFLIGSLISSFPAAFVGAFIAILIKNDQLHSRFSLQKSILKGVFLGFLTGLGISLFISILFRRGDLITYIVYTSIVLILASISGGWTAKKIALISTSDNSNQSIDALK